MDIKENFQVKLNELRGKGTVDKKEMQTHIRKKHDAAWTKTQRIRKEKKSAGPADTKDMDKYRNRLAKMHNKLDEVKDENFGKPMELGKVVRYAKNPDPKKMDKIGKKIADIKAKAKKK